jgi:hypothetical protein
VKIPAHSRRHRGRQLALLASVIVLGLASRRYAGAIPAFIARYAGDTLWATAAYLTLGLIWPGARVRSLAIGAAVISLAVELSQLAQPHWLQSVRRWPGAGLLLGYGFVASDLACYTVGVALGAALDQMLGLRAADNGAGHPGAGRHATPVRDTSSTMEAP